MRQGQQNHRRGRSRSSNSSNSSNNNNRKGHNPLSRSYESTGPDVKIRGTASHIAEKYMALARDASAAGDLVMAENYLQHAEHYNRIIMAAHAQLRAEDPATGLPRARRSELDPPGEGGEYGFDDMEDDQDGPDQSGDAFGSDQSRFNEPRPHEQRQYEPRQPEPRQHEQRQQEPRQHEPRQQQPRFQDQPRVDDLPPFIGRPVFANPPGVGPDQPQPRSYEPRQPRQSQDNRQEGRVEGRADAGRGDGRGPRRRGRQDNGGRPRPQHQDRAPVQDGAPADVNGNTAPYAEPVQRIAPEGSDGD